MSRRNWVRLDNASNIFLAARTDADPKVFRLSAETDHDVDPQLLQTALDTTFDRYPLYRAVLRRGVFWYYLQDSDLRPLVTVEDQHTCAPIYQADRRTLLFRVVHHHRRIVLEVFHALSDGTGALWFLTDLVEAYHRLRYPGEGAIGTGASDVGAPGSGTSATPDVGPRPGDDPAELTHHLAADSFAHYFRRRRVRRGRGRGEGAALTAAGGDGGEGPVRDEPARQDPARDEPTPPEPDRPPRRTGMKVYRVPGTRTPDNRTRAVELTMPAREALAQAREEGVSLTMYLIALFFESVRRSSGGLGTRRTLSASVPVNLRQFFPSTSARNFFATVRVAHVYGEGADDLGAVCRALDTQFRPAASSEALERRLRRFIRFERSPALRILPRPLKDLILRLVNWKTNRGLTVAVSNLGRVSLPGASAAHVGRMLFHVSAVRPQFCAISHAGQLTVTFTSPFTETGHVREFARLLTDRGVNVTVAAARVTEEELAGSAP